MVNINPETGIPYGIISSGVMCPYVVDALMYEHGTNESDKEALAEAKLEFLQEKLSMEEFDELAEEDYDEVLDDLGWDDLTFWDSCGIDEPFIHGEYEGVYYQTSWLGGALDFVIISSPYITEKATKGSPCVPNMGVLDELDGDYQCYDVPASWRADNAD